LSVQVDPELHFIAHPPLGHENAHVEPLAQSKLHGSVDPQVRLQFEPLTHEQSLPAVQFGDDAVDPSSLHATSNPKTATTRPGRTRAKESFFTVEAMLRRVSA